MELTYVYNITDFRKHLRRIIDQVTSTGSAVELTVRDTTQAVVLPAEYRPLVQETVDYSKWMALMFVERLLPDAPAYLKESQIREFENLPVDGLKSLLSVDSLPVKRPLRDRISKIIGHDIINRLEKRYKIARAIRDAEKEGLFDAAEHLTTIQDLK